MINFLNLEYFLVAAEELNFTRAARKLYISQQSLSNHISNLEKEFDVILFNRTSPLTLTYAGRALKTRARELLDLRDETYKEISDIKDFSRTAFHRSLPYPRQGHPAGNPAHLPVPVSGHRASPGGGKFQPAGLRPAPRKHRPDD